MWRRQWCVPRDNRPLGAPLLDLGHRVPDFTPTRAGLCISGDAMCPSHECQKTNTSTDNAAMLPPSALTSRPSAPRRFRLSLRRETARDSADTLRDIIKGPKSAGDVLASRCAGQQARTPPSSLGFQLDDFKLDEHEVGERAPSQAVGPIPW